MPALKGWRIGNTTVRSPRRIPDGLRVFAEQFDGKENDRQLQSDLWVALVDAGVVDAELGEGEQHDWGGRKWIHAFAELGLIRREAIAGRRQRLRVTAVGRALLDGAEPPAEIFLRQLLKYHLGSPLQSESDFAGFDIYPFRFFLAVLWRLRERGEAGLTKEEIALFVVTRTKDDEVEDVVDDVLRFRGVIAKEVGNVAKRRRAMDSRVRSGQRLFEQEIADRQRQLGELVRLRKRGKPWSDRGVRQALEAVVRTPRGAETAPSANLAADLRGRLDAGDVAGARELLSNHIARRRTGTLKDYADTIVRHVSLTDLFSPRGRRLELRTTDQLPVIEALVAEGLPPFDPVTYADDFWNPAVPQLPTERTEVVRAQAEQLLAAAENEAARLGRHVEVALDPKASRKELLEKRDALENEVITLRLERWAQGLRRPEELRQMLQMHHDIRRGELAAGVYRPAFQEWNWWRIFLALDQLACAVAATHNFPIDAELAPVHHARGGVADMVFEYDDWLLVGEATLINGPRQWSAEGEPVPRHVADVAAKFPGKDVFAVFLAPVIDPNTAQTFFKFLTTPYFVGDKQLTLKIVPVPESDALRLIEKIEKDAAFTTAELRELLQACVDTARGCANGPEWLAEIKRLWATRLAVAAAA